MNISQVDDEHTAHTNPYTAFQRALDIREKLLERQIGQAKVLELCVGPSLPVLDLEYGKWLIECYGNDVDFRWKQHYPEGKWVMGNCLKIDYDLYDCVVFAPPLSRGCTGKREDALMIEEVTPRFEDFLQAVRFYKGLIIMVLPARSLATRQDRDQLHKLLSKISDPTVVSRTDGKIRKYVEIHFYNKNP